MRDINNIKMSRLTLRYGQETYDYQSIPMGTSDIVVDIP